jgi:hypothetical protein
MLLPVPRNIEIALSSLRPFLEALPDGCWLTSDCIRHHVWSDNGYSGSFDVVHEGPLHDQLGQLQRGNMCAWRLHSPERTGHFNAYSWVHSRPETASSIAARLNGGRIDIIAPYGFSDLLRGVIRRTRFGPPMDQLHARHSYWRHLWPDLRVIHTRAPKFEGQTRYSFQPDWRYG